MTNALDIEFDQKLGDAFDRKLAELLDNNVNFAGAPGGGGASTVGPEARSKLRNLLKYYAKKAHPFRACVRDNTKRFGPDGAKRICATLKDLLRGTTRWRGHPEIDHGSAGLRGLAEPVPEIDDDTLALIEHLSEMDLYTLLDLAALDES